MKTKEYFFNNFDEFIGAIVPNGAIGKQLWGYIFRGEDSGKYSLLPSALRLENVEKLKQQLSLNHFKINETEWLQVFSEYRILKNFYRIANESGLKVHGGSLMERHYFDDVDPEFLFKQDKIEWIDPELSELAALAQHYGIITRLLDWSSDPFTALYFACIGSMKKLQEGKADNLTLWALDAKKIQVNEQHIYTLREDNCPLKIIVPSYYSNPNLKAQKGVLSYWKISTIFSDNKPVERTPLDLLIENISTHGEEPLLYKFILPNKYSLDLYRWITRLGYNASNIYPGYRGVAQQMQEESLFWRIKNKE